MRLIQLGDYYFNLEAISAFRKSFHDDEQTVLFTSGQDATSAGFLIELPIEDVLEELENARLIMIGADLLAKESSSDA